MIRPDKQTRVISAYNLLFSRLLSITNHHLFLAMSAALTYSGLAWPDKTGAVYRELQTLLGKDGGW